MDAETLTPEKNYLVCIDRKGNLLIGEDYRNSMGGTSETHPMLWEDATFTAPTPESLKGKSGAIRIRADGSVDVAGYHMKENSSAAADAISQKLLEMDPELKIRQTPGRISDLDNH